MNDNRRSNAAESLRSFFDHQLLHLQDLISGLGSHTPDTEPLSEEDEQIVENFVDASNIKIRAVHDYAQQLREHVRALYAYVLDIAEQIPPPVELNQDAFRLNPLVNSLFVNTDEIDKVCKTTPEMQTFLRTHQSYQVPVIYALLTAYKSEKSILGIGMLGELMVRDMPQQTVNFSAHKLHIPCTSSAELAIAVEKYLFDRVVVLIRQEMSAKAANHALNTDDHSYQARLNSLANPNVYLNILIEHLAVPANLLRIDKTHFRLNKLGIKLSEDDNQRANEFDIYEITWSDNTRNVLLQIAYPQ